MDSEIIASDGNLEVTGATTAGNYFVSNYPPFSVWRAEYVKDAFEALDRKPATDTALGVYAHIPFCRKRCHFCYFKVYTDYDSGRVDAYVEALIAELKLYAGRAFVDGRRPKFVYFGGGTPSYLSTSNLLHLSDSMKELLPWDDAEEVAFECEPGTLTRHKLEVIRSMGVTRLSLGVENFDDGILEINGRSHKSKEILKSYEMARALNFPQINVDLIAGMVGETEENWRECVRSVLDLAPESVTVYQMEIPYNTTVFQEMKAQGENVAPVADWPTKRRWVLYAFSQLEKAGYTLGSAYTAVKDPSATQFLYRDLLWRGADLIGLGVASFGHIGGTHFQNEKDMGPYMTEVGRGKLPIHRALTPTQDERLIREFILQMKLGYVHTAYFREKFGVDVTERFAEPLGRLRDWRFLTIQDEKLALSRDGLMQVDRLLHEFYLPEHSEVRYT